MHYEGCRVGGWIRHMQISFSKFFCELMEWLMVVCPSRGNWVLQHTHTHSHSKINMSRGIAWQNINWDVCFHSLSAQRPDCGARSHWYVNHVPTSCLSAKWNHYRGCTRLCLSHEASKMSWWQNSLFVISRSVAPFISLIKMAMKRTPKPHILS